MKSIGIVAPFFGKLPKLYEVWAKTVAANPTVEFHLVGDCFSGLEAGPNVTIHHVGLDELQQRLADRLDIRPIDRAYKLCDFKPAYRMLFPDILGGYDIWGFCDFDLIFGDIRTVVDLDTLPDNWGRLFDYGHFSLFANRNEANTAFLEPTRGFDSWSFVKDSRLIWIYDERYERCLGGVNGLLEQNGLTVLPHSDRYADPQPRYRGFIENKTGEGPNLIFHWKSGRLRKLALSGGNSQISDICYAHFQKRDPQIIWLGTDEALVVPSHWPAPSTMQDAVRMASTMREADGEYRATSLDQSTLAKARDWGQFVFEAATSRHPLATMQTFRDGLRFKR